MLVAGEELVLGDDSEAEPVGTEEFAGQVVPKVVTECETAEQIPFAVAVHITSTPQVSPTVVPSTGQLHSYNYNKIMAIQNKFLPDFHQ